MSMPARWVSDMTARTADVAIAARYETGARLKHITHYVIGSERPAVCGTLTDGSGVYADEHRIPNSLCDACLTYLFESTR